jgi:hypothetical protein
VLDFPKEAKILAKVILVVHLFAEKTARLS